MQLPVHDHTHQRARSAIEVRDMGVVVQANLVQLKVADARRRGIEKKDHELAVTSPGSVTRFREHLLSADLVANYDEPSLRLRMHELWGQFCLFRWTLHADESGEDLVRMSSELHLRCDAHLAAKEAEIHALLWRMRHEQRVRCDASYADSAEFRSNSKWAESIPAMIHGQSVSQCNDESLLAVSCEYVGMLAAIRWVADGDMRWGDERLMDVSDQPFVDG